jgi:hypothetical protein
VPLGLYALLTWRAQRRHPTWQIDAVARSFLAPPTARWRGPWVVFMGWFTAGWFTAGGVAAIDWTSPGETGVWTNPVVIAVIAAVIAAFGLITIASVGNRPRLALTPDGITLRGLVRTVTIGWDQIGPGEPPHPRTVNPHFVTVRYAERTSTGYRMTRWRLPAHDLHIDSAFLAATIRHYASHPDDRLGIGTDAGLRHLRCAVGV